MNWKNRIKISLDLIKQTIQTFTAQGENEILLFGLQELTDYYEGDYFDSLSEEEQQNQSRLILNTYLKVCGSRFNKYFEQKYAQRYEEVSEEIAKERLLIDYLNDIKNGSDNIMSMNINDWVEQAGIIVLDKVSSSTIEE